MVFHTVVCLVFGRVPIPMCLHYGGSYTVMKPTIVTEPGIIQFFARTFDLKSKTGIPESEGA